MKIPDFIRNLVGDIAYRLLKITYPPGKEFYAISWLAAKMNCFAIINQNALLSMVIKDQKGKKDKAGWEIRDSDYERCQTCGPKP